MQRLCKFARIWSSHCSQKSIMKSSYLIIFRQFCTTVKSDNNIITSYKSQWLVQITSTFLSVKFSFVKLSLESWYVIFSNRPNYSFYSASDVIIHPDNHMSAWHTTTIKISMRMECFNVKIKCVQMEGVSRFFSEFWVSWTTFLWP